MNEFVERSDILVAADVWPLLERAGLTGFDVIMNFPGGTRVVHKRGRSVFRFEAEGRAFYLKRNRLHRTELFKQFSHGKLPPRSALQEWTFIQAVSQAGIPTVRPVAFGERIFFGIETASFTVTEELYGAHPLDELVYDKFNGPGRFHEKRALIRQLADLARHLHGAGMNHQDFYLNHFFLGEDNELFLLDLQRVQRRACTPEYSIIKDLAQLAFSARRFPFITRSDHLRFLLAYLGESRLSRGSRRLLTKVGRKADSIARHDIKLTARRRARGEMKRVDVDEVLCSREHDRHMINVLLLIKRYSGNYPLLNEMVKLDKQRFRVVVCYLSGRNDGENDLERLVARCDYLETLSRWIRPANFFLLKRLRTIIDQEKIDVVNCHLQRSIAVGVLAARLADCRPRVVATLHGFGSGKNWKRQIGNRIWYRFLDRLIGVSNAVAVDLRQTNSFFPSERIVTVRNGLNLEHMRLDDSPQQLREKILPNHTNEFWFGTLGRLSAVKNQECLIRAFALVAAEDARVRLLLAGRGDLEEHLKTLTQELGVSERVTFLGFRRDVPQILNALDVFLLPSLREGLGLALLEAMAAGRPVIASRVGGIPEVFGATEMGCLVEPASVEGLTAAMLTLAKASDDERKRLGRNARARALGAFSARRMVEGYERVYADVCQKSPSAPQDALDYQLETVVCGLCGSSDYRVVIHRAKELYNGLDAYFDVVQCNACGFIFTNPRPTTASLGGFYPDTASYYQPDKKRILAGAGFKRGWRGQLQRSLLANYFDYELRHLPRFCDAPAWLLQRSRLYASHLPRWVPEGRLLDVGCAWGGYLWRMQQLGWEAHGVELNAQAAKFARQELGLKSVRAGSIDELDYPEGFFDVVHMSMALEHVPDPLATLRKLERLLKDNGQLILSVPDIEGVEARLFKKKSYTLQVPQHLSHFSPATIRAGLESAGFIVERIVHQRTKSDFVKSAAYMDDSWLKRFLLCSPVRRLCLGPLVSLLAMMGRTSRMSVYAVKRAAVR